MIVSQVVLLFADEYESVPLVPLNVYVWLSLPFDTVAFASWVYEPLTVIGTDITSVDMPCTKVFGVFTIAATLELPSVNVAVPTLGWSTEVFI